MSSLKKIYKDKVAPELAKEFNFTSAMQIPSIKCVSLNMGLGEGSQNNKIIVIDEGRIAAEGTHSELIQSSPIYQEIFASQLGNGVTTE